MVMVSSCVGVGAKLISFGKERKEFKMEKDGWRNKETKKRERKGKYITLVFLVLINTSLDLGQKLF